MTRDFEFIAATIKDNLSPPIREEVAKVFAARLHYTNAGFKPDRFLRACGVSRND